MGELLHGIRGRGMYKLYTALRSWSLGYNTNMTQTVSTFKRERVRIMVNIAGVLKQGVVGSFFEVFEGIQEV